MLITDPIRKADTMLHLTAGNFDAETTHSPLPVVVMFYAVWCGKCAMMKPIVEELEPRYRNKVRFCEVEIDESPLLAAKYDADIVPTFVFFQNGRLLGIMQGLSTKSSSSRDYRKSLEIVKAYFLCKYSRICYIRGDK